MRDQLTNNFRIAANSQETRSTILTLLTVRMQHTLNGGLTEFIGHYVNDYLPLDSAWEGESVVYQPAAFKISLGSDINDSVPKTKLDFDSGDRQFIRMIRASEGTPKVYMQVVLAEDPLDIQIGPVEFQVEAFSVKSTSVSADLTVEPVLSEPVPASRYTPQTFPQIWRGSPQS